MKNSEPQLNVSDEKELEGCTIGVGEKPGGGGFRLAMGERAGESHGGVFCCVGAGVPLRVPLSESSHPGLPP